MKKQKPVLGPAIERTSVDGWEDKRWWIILRELYAEDHRSIGTLRPAFGPQAIHALTGTFRLRNTMQKFLPSELP